MTWQMYSLPAIFDQVANLTRMPQEMRRDLKHHGSLGTFYGGICYACLMSTTGHVSLTSHLKVLEISWRSLGDRRGLHPSVGAKEPRCVFLNPAKASEKATNWMLVDSRVVLGITVENI